MLPLASRWHATSQLWLYSLYPTRLRVLFLVFIFLDFLSAESDHVLCFVFPGGEREFTNCATTHVNWQT